MMQIDNNSHHVPRDVSFWGCGFSNTGERHCSMENRGARQVFTRHASSQRLLSHM
jgi:hypothetical protein